MYQIVHDGDILCYLDVPWIEVIITWSIWVYSVLCWSYRLVQTRFDCRCLTFVCILGLHVLVHCYMWVNLAFMEIMRKWRQSDMLLWVDGLTALLPLDNAFTCIEVGYSISKVYLIIISILKCCCLMLKWSSYFLYILAQSVPSGITGVRVKDERGPWNRWWLHLAIQEVYSLI